VRIDARSDGRRTDVRIGIDGVAIARPMLAYWRREYGHEPVLFEQPDRLRTEG
jgi:hypothetical protein